LERGGSSFVGRGLSDRTIKLRNWCILLFDLFEYLNLCKKIQISFLVCRQVMFLSSVCFKYCKLGSSAHF
jgi:hypothetical protein